MAGGIDWFRWHHGSVTDPKFQLVARRAGASLPDVLAVWAYILERASAATDRGCFGDIDCEAVDCMFGFPGTESRTADILAAMTDRALIKGGWIVAWDRRQPRREDDTAAERKRRQREREHEALVLAVTTDKSRDVTQRHAQVTHGHDRGEESREELPPATRVPPSAEADKAPRPGRKKPVKLAMPVDFAVSDRVTAWAKKHGYDRLPEHLDAFKRKVAANGYTYVDWDAAFMESIREDWAKLRGRPANGSAPPPERDNSAWTESRSGIEAKGKDLGLGAWDRAAWETGQGGIDWTTYSARVFKAAGITPRAA